MPFTPFHFGPGLLIKSTKLHFSFLIFLLSQILIDIEPGYHLLSQHERLHTFAHTFLGSLAIVIILLPLYRLKRFGQLKDVAFSALIGVWSHVFLDSIMHSDVEPFWPFSNYNPFLNVISLFALHLFCVAAGVFGIVLLLLRKRWLPTFSLTVQRKK